jgi:flagellar assembly protein FliH
MSLFRLVARDRLNEAEVRPYLTADGNPNSNGATASTECRVVQLESLDLLNLGPYCLLLAAQEKALETLAQAQKEAEQIRAEAAAQGAILGREEAKRELLPSLTAFANAGQSLILFEERMIQDYTAQLVRLALEIAEKIIGKAAEADSNIAASVLERAQREVGESKHMRIFLHPADYTALAGVAYELVQMGSHRGRQIEVVSAEDVGRGGCRLETEIGMVDATVPVQLAEIRRQLLDEEPPLQSTGKVP